MMSISDYMVESTAYPLHLDHRSTSRSAHSPIYTENPQAFYMRHHHTENDVMEMSTLRHRNTQRFHFPYGTTDYLQHMHSGLRSSGSGSSYSRVDRRGRKALASPSWNVSQKRPSTSSPYMRTAHLDGRAEEIAAFTGRRK
ncbi:hypothetical protein AVEN_105538-1 [Araneus ventricosus]|uniref:Uncharacterized protein n=1 Tax=Araneus ventricosus TaxID=182803 RepID=A0A4Y2GSL0_ARAVE|nr:hypothetical protein AVEN_105538-1 [Araneus ventricosus]